MLTEKIVEDTVSIGIRPQGECVKIILFDWLREDILGLIFIQ